jgi:hypothetical protein
VTFPGTFEWTTELQDRLPVFAERPPSEVEWEDLLARMELAPRAFQLAADDASGSPRVAHVLASAFALESWFAAALRELQAGGTVPLASGLAPAAGGALAGREVLDGFSALRARNFAALQRRGISVWDWSAATHQEGGRVTTFQAASAVVEMDGRHLAVLRGDVAR